MAGDLKVRRCAIYTRKSTEHGLELEFNSLDAQREACEPISRARPRRVGGPFPSSMMTRPIPGATSTALP
jgi:hypothetical protein